MGAPISDEGQDPGEIRQRILQIMAPGGIFVRQDLIKALETISRQRIDNAIFDLIRRGAVERAGRGVYALTGTALVRPVVAPEGLVVKAGRRSRQPMVRAGEAGQPRRIFDTRQRLLRAISDHGMMHRKELLAGFPTEARASVDVMLGNLVKAGLIQRSGPGRYHIPGYVPGPEGTRSHPSPSQAETPRQMNGKTRKASLDWSRDILNYLATPRLGAAILEDFHVTPRAASNRLAILMKKGQVFSIRVGRGLERGVRGELYCASPERLTEIEELQAALPAPHITQILSSIPDKGWANLYDAAYVKGSVAGRLPKIVQELMGRGLIRLGRSKGIDYVAKTTGGLAIARAEWPYAPAVAEIEDLEIIDPVRKERRHPARIG
ncbi:hypothetical protein ACEUZ9_004080 [Paracoccus litorisediminis]|uniref:hypothetical protein n=1 Tax=Paracoccus litorisediminis TaxID=2006130 RepID=UPI003733F897